MTELNRQLIADLARLSVRYGPDDWDHLLELLEDERRRGQVTRLLRELAASSRARRQNRPKGSRPAPPRAHRVREALAAIGEVDPGRAELLEEVWRKLRQRELLPTLPLIRAFAEATGLKGLGGSKRDQAVTELMEQIVDMPHEELERLMRETVVQDRKLGEEYERWVRLILGQPSSTTE